MSRIPKRLKDETGSVLVIALLMLVFLTLLGIASTTTTSIELQIAQNERIYQNHFNAAEAAALHAIQWVADASSEDLVDYDNFDFYSNYKASPWNGDAEAALEDFRNPSNDFWGVGANSKSAAMPVEDGSGNDMYPNTRFAVVFAGTAAEETLDETSEEVVNIYHCFGLYRVTTPGDPDRGEVIIEIGYKRRS